MNLIEKLDSVVKLCDAACAMVPSPEGVAAIKQAETAAADFVIENHDSIRQAMLKAALWDKHSGSFSVLEAMLDAASPLVLNKLKAIDAARATPKDQPND